MRLTLVIALALAACGGAASQAEDPALIRADGRAIDGDTVSFDVRILASLSRNLALRLLLRGFRPVAALSPKAGGGRPEPPQQL